MHYGLGEFNNPYKILKVIKLTWYWHVLSLHTEIKLITVLYYLWQLLPQECSWISCVNMHLNKYPRLLFHSLLVNTRSELNIWGNCKQVFRWAVVTEKCVRSGLIRIFNYTQAQQLVKLPCIVNQSWIKVQDHLSIYLPVVQCFINCTVVQKVCPMHDFCQ
jgi:hypothetical protein